MAGCLCGRRERARRRPAAAEEALVGGMASAATTSSWCGHCGAGLAVPPGARSSASVRCALCHRVTRVERRGGRGVGEGDDSGAYAPASSPPPVRRELTLPTGYPVVRGRKRALLVGVSYKGTSYELKGTVNDVNCMRRLLCDKFGFPDDCILVLTEEMGDDTRRVPTRENLLLAMRWLVDGCDAGDSLVFHFSGHGVQKLDVNGEEVDGYDEALCPLDFEQSGKILDDEINEAIVRPLGPGVKLHAIIDTCHSGTILDLSYLCRLSRTGYWQWEHHSPRQDLEKGTSGGLAISISGCSDNQTSADSSGFPDEAAGVGAMTYSFIKAVESEPGTTYGRLLSAMRATIRDGQGSVGRRLLPGRLGEFVRRMVPSGSVQEPQLCSSEIFDIYKKPFLL
ncbi:hypothetical protein GUJ93_ZPchr0003g18358 [Zizania palustris]|uniref:Uncharacterized protein n=1 Tax=Zizania palustris TaxID=103762 RepID=A0A8J5SCF2_ZIZPA|nr:hypothetical protein GUJ93_ZPchr0003g18358 [Zizania palustris]